MNAKSLEGLTRWASNCRDLRARASEVKVRSPLHMWFISPIGQLLAFAGIYVLTYLAGLVRPKLLYGETPADNNDGEKSRLFLDYRIFLLTTFAAFEVIFGTELVAEVKNSFDTPLLAFVVGQALYVLTVFLIVCWSALFVWIASGVARSPLRACQAIMVAGYGITVVWLTLPLLFAIFTIPVLSIDAWLVDAFEKDSSHLIALGAVGLLAMICAVKVTFVEPVAAVRPDASKGLLWLGWFIGVFLMSIGSFGISIVWMGLDVIFD